ncbi:MAG: arginine repressor [Clostridiales bacterium]|nr:arginine repressor [Clostridiales bacterium]
MKYKRQGQIIRIIRENKIRTHEQLIEKLSEAGFKVTQATISRDIKELGLVKAPDKGGAVYAQPSEPRSTSERVSSFADTVLNVECAMHTVVVKTYPGMAQAVAASMDELMKNEIIGSVAGDDTILVVTADENAAHRAAEKICKLFK